MFRLITNESIITGKEFQKKSSRLSRIQKLAFQTSQLLKSLHWSEDIITVQSSPISQMLLSSYTVKTKFPEVRVLNQNHRVQRDFPQYAIFPPATKCQLIEKLVVFLAVGYYPNLRLQKKHKHRKNLSFSTRYTSNSSKMQVSSVPILNSPCYVTHIM